MQKRRLALGLAFLFLIINIVFTIPVFSASSYIIGVNNDVITLSPSSPNPYVRDRMVYMPWEFFYEDLGLSYSYDATDEIITYNYGTKSISFNTKLHMAIDQDGNVNYVSVYKSGATYMVPADILARRLGIKLSRNDDTPMIRFITSTSAIPDSEFIKKATSVQNPEVVTPPDTQAPSIDKKQYSLYLTFDNAPGPGTEKALDVLDTFGLKGIFFLTKDKVKENPDLVFRIIASGHLIGMNGSIYAASHSYVVSDVISDLDGFSSWLSRRFKAVPLAYRPPYESRNDIKATDEEALREAGYAVWGYQINAFYEGRKTSSYTAYVNTTMRISNLARDSAILFDSSETSAGMLEDFIRYANRNGYKVRSITPTMLPK